MGLSDPDADWTKMCDVQDDLKEMKTDDTVSEENRDKLITFYQNYLKGFECELSL